MNFLTTPGSVIDDNMVVYRSTNCSTLTQLACDDLNGPGWMPYISLGGLVPGNSFTFVIIYGLEGQQLQATSVFASKLHAVLP